MSEGATSPSELARAGKLQMCLMKQNPLFTVSDVLLEQTCSQIKILKVTIRIYLHNYCQRSSWNVLSSARGASWLSLPACPCLQAGLLLGAVSQPFPAQRGFCSRRDPSVLFVYLLSGLCWERTAGQSQLTPGTEALAGAASAGGTSLPGQRAALGLCSRGLCPPCPPM